jgi:hypothetical protein|tara:strand:- start:79 stop:639 length:561 start_codon:yes stop_codon:yes gene_type:complete
MSKEKNAHYVDNKKFYAEITVWKQQWDESVAKGEPTPQCTHYLGECFVKISNHLAYKSNFVNYTFRDEMILDGIENCLRYADRFNPEKSKNPFAYFTQITYYSFIRRIKKEARQTETAMNYLQSIDLQQLLDEVEGDSGSYEYLKWVQTQVDLNAKEKQSLNSISDKKTVKRRPKYFDKKEEELDI